MINIMPKILAIYLPQFHETRDNNLWWGKGFTDWESVKSAEKYFEGHEEPKIPLGGNYYDLSKKQTMERQAELAKQYGIEGFCFYHYYFKNGKMELELPAENLLKWKDIDMPFCFNWASESWIRSWSRIAGNVWAEKYEMQDDNLQNGVLALQDYGKETEWRNHFEYLLPFFLDDRYIKIEGKPVFIFYSPDDIVSLRNMVQCWRKWAVEAGLAGLYLIGAHMNSASDSLDAAIIYEPRNAISHLNENGEVSINNGVRCFLYRRLWDEVLKTKPIYGYKTFFCGVSGYDDTPRRGKSGECLINRSSAVFQDGLKQLIQKSMAYNNEFVFLNAWNEWGEGMYLEPDEMTGYAYLEAVKLAIQSALTEKNSFKEDENNQNIREELLKLDRDVKKFKKLFHIMDKWLYIVQENHSWLKEYFATEGIESVAIYGMAALGKHLLFQLKKENVNVLFGIDQYVGQYGNDFAVYRPEDNFPTVDAIIITAYEAEEIRYKMAEKYSGRLLTLEEVLDRLL